MTARLNLTLLFLAVTGVLNAQERDRLTVGQVSPLVIPRLASPIKLDGKSDEPAWRDVAPYRYVVMEPNFGTEPSERTELLLAHDGDCLYVAGRLYDSEPEKIQANSKQRDSEDASSDWFVVVVDSFNDKENALAFATTPAGLRWDAAVANDAQGKMPLNFSWNTFWDVAVARNGEGWFAEMRIPFSSLRFQDRDGQAVMGIISWRCIARKNERVIFPSIPPDWGGWSKFKVSRAREFVFHGVRSRSPLYITPYLVGGPGRAYTLNGAGTAYDRADVFERGLGLDVKYGLTSNLTLDLTLNPDFAQVEADDQQVNLTRFSLFFPEKRLFFQERAGLFDFAFEAVEQNRLFYSRRIGLYDERLVRILGGARLVGRVGDWDVGFLDMQTEAVESRPAENFGVLRVRRQVFNPYSYVGGMVTSRLDGRGAFNLAYGLDGVVKLWGEDYLTVKWAQTFQDGFRNDALSLEPARIFVSWLRRTTTGFGYGVVYSRAGADYEPGLGYEWRKDFSRHLVHLGYGWQPGPTSPLFSHTVSLDGLAYVSNADGHLESAWISPSWSFQTKGGFEGLINPVVYYEDVPAAFSLAEEVEVRTGRYTYGGLYSVFATPSGRSLSASVTAEAGTFYDGRRLSVNLQPRWNASAVLQLDGTYEVNRVQFDRRGQGFTAHIGRFRALVMLTTKLSAAAFVQYNSASEAVIANARLRYNPREGVDLYLVYNEGLNTDRFREFPVRPLTSNRTVLLKCSYTFQLGGR